MEKKRETPMTREALLAGQAAHKDSHGQELFDPDACQVCWSYTLALMGVAVDPRRLT